MVDREVIRRHLQALEEAVSVLNQYRDTTTTTLRNTIETRYVVERGLQLAIQNLLDIGNHILTMLGHHTIDNYADIITGLARAKVIPASFSRRIIKMPGLRNILVHEYVRVNPAKLRTILKDHVDDFPRFAAYVERWLASQLSDP